MIVVVVRIKPVQRVGYVGYPHSQFSADGLGSADIQVRVGLQKYLHSVQEVVELRVLGQIAGLRETGIWQERGQYQHKDWH